MLYLGLPFRRVHLCNSLGNKTILMLLYSLDIPRDPVGTAGDTAFQLETQSRL